MKTSQRQVIIAGNWKMNKTSREAVTLTEEIQSAIATLPAQDTLPGIILIPPFTALPALKTSLKKSNIKLGAQNMDWRDSGAYTGEISPLMLIDLGVQYVLVGHSERRQYFGETNATVNSRLKAALNHGLKPILCVGEMIDERDANLTDAVVSRQVGAALTDVNPKQFPEIIIAYEPVWAIGTGNNCDAAEANRVCGIIRKTVASLCTKTEGNSKSSPQFDANTMPVLYGGSVKANNITEQLKQDHVDGALVGGASLDSKEFTAIIKAAQERIKSQRAAAAR